MSEIPFVPYSSTLRDVLRKKYIRNVAVWLLGKDENSILAQAANSAWESALAIIFFAKVNHIFAECGEEADLRELFQYKSAVVARWLLTKKITTPEKYVCWERVTWDTSVVIRGLLTVLKEHRDSFSQSEQEEIIDAIVGGTKWLNHRFSQWETQVKYPFGPADVAQIVITMLYLAYEFPEIHGRICLEFYGDARQDDLIDKIIEYLLHKKTENTLTVTTSDGTEEDVVTYWWDDYFSTAEVVESLALFYEYCRSGSTSDLHKRLLPAVKEAIIRACAYFEHGQVEGMWGTHIDTIRVLTTYVMLRRMIPQRESGLGDPLIIPEIHTVFKALRWMCDEKQIFTDGSFLHTMFLTIFYSLALVEIYHSWEPACDPIDKIYDDVLWFSPVRTTPERSKRLAAELKNGQLEEQLDQINNQIAISDKNLRVARRVQGKLVFTFFIVLIAIPLFVLIANLTNSMDLYLRVPNYDNFFQLLAVYIPIVAGLIALVWNFEKIQSATE